MEMSVGRDLTLTIALSFQNHFILSIETYVRTLFKDKSNCFMYVHNISPKQLCVTVIEIVVGQYVIIYTSYNTVVWRHKTIRFTMYY